MSENPFPAITICLNDPISSNTMNLASVLKWEGQNKTDEEWVFIHLNDELLYSTNCIAVHLYIIANTFIYTHDWNYREVKGLIYKKNTFFSNVFERNIHDL